jgi:hypothetical protein
MLARDLNNCAVLARSHPTRGSNGPGPTGVRIHDGALGYGRTPRRSTACSASSGPPAPRLRNIAEIGVRTFGWAYRNRGLPVPPLMPSVRLDTPFAEAWQWAGSTGDSVQGDAVAFCQVVTQTRNVADTSLSVKGETALHWMTIVMLVRQGAAAPGTRYRAR